MLRSIFVIGLMLIGLRYAFKGAFYVLLCYLWIAYFRPDQWLWFDFTSKLDLSFVVGIAALICAVFSRERWRFGFGSGLLLLFLAQGLLSVTHSSAFDTAWPFWREFARTVVMSVLITVLVNTEERVRLTILVIAFSLAFEGAKQGFVQFVLNPTMANDNPLPMFGDNNGVGVGMLMLVPLLVTAAATALTRRERYFERFLGLGVLLRALGTYSRGAFLSAVALGLYYMARARRRFVMAAVVAVLASLVVVALPTGYWSRISTIQTDTENPDAMDESAASRIYFWQIALEMANNHPFIGIGQNAYNALYNQYDPSRGLYGVNRAVHSSWFGVLAEMGYPGLVMFLVLLGYSILAAARARQAARLHPELQKLAQYATAIEASIVAFAVGGSFVDMQFCEMLWHLFALQIAINYLVRDRLAVAEQAPVPLRGLIAGLPTRVSAQRATRQAQVVR